MFYESCKICLNSCRIKAFLVGKKKLFQKKNNIFFKWYSTETCKKKLESKANLFDSLDKSNIKDDSELLQDSKKFSSNQNGSREKEKEKKLRNDLTDWAFTNKISYKAFTRLLKILKENDVCHLPVSPSTLFKKADNEIQMISMPPGIYVHFGIKNKLDLLIKVLEEKKLLSEKNVSLSVFVDHLPLIKKTNEGYWVIMGSISGFQNTIFMIGAYFGNKNPENSNFFLENFVNEIKSLCLKGLSVCGETYNINVRRIICDMRAKSYILNIKLGGYYGCTKCHASGIYSSHKIFLPEISKPRKDNDFRINEALYKTEKSKLLEIPDFGVVTNVPLDYMHLVCIGVLKKLMTLWPEESGIWTYDTLDWPIEFSRIKHNRKFSAWSPSQFRQFLLYHGPMALKNLLTQEKYNHFLKLHLACRILCLNSANTELVDVARNLLANFIRSYIRIYGVHEMNYNIHGLYHLADDYELHGPLDEFSAFPFEKFLMAMKNSIKAMNKKTFLQSSFARSYDRVFEKNLAKLRRKQFSLSREKSRGDHGEAAQADDGFRPNLKSYERLKMSNLSIVAGHPGDDCVILKNGRIVKVVEILQDSRRIGGTPLVRALEYLSLSDLYKKPLESSLVGFFLAGNMSSRADIWPADFIAGKCVRMGKCEGKEIICRMMATEY